MSCMANVSMIGITGSISFGEGADPIKNVKIDRIQGEPILELFSAIVLLKKLTLSFFAV